MSTVLAVVVPLVVAAGIASRPPIAEMERLPAETRSADGFSIQIAEEKRVRVDAASLSISLLQNPDDLGRYAVEFWPDDGQGVNGADVLVYWTTEPADKQSTPPAGAHVIGTLAGLQPRRFVLPESARPGHGRLLFYSVAQQRLFDETWPLPDTSDVK